MHCLCVAFVLKFRDRQSKYRRVMFSHLPRSFGRGMETSRCFPGRRSTPAGWRRTGGSCPTGPSRRRHHPRLQPPTWRLLSPRWSLGCCWSDGLLRHPLPLLPPSACPRGWGTVGCSPSLFTLSLSDGRLFIGTSTCPIFLQCRNYGVWWIKIIDWVFWVTKIYGRHVTLTMAGKSP